MKWFNKKATKKVNVQLANDLMKQSQVAVDKMPPINILVAGKTGSGKSTLINALFREKIAKTGVGMPITPHVEKLTKAGVPLTLFDTRGLELSADLQQVVLKELVQLIDTHEAYGDNQQIHVVYYCINAQMGRIEPLEIEIISALASTLPVVIVLTQAIGNNVNEFEKYLATLSLNVASVVSVLAKDFELHKGSKVSAYGLQKLIDTTLTIIPSSVHQAFINAQQIDIDKKVAKARSWAHQYIKTSFGVGFAPVPISDATILVPLQISMLSHITAIFGLSLDKAQLVSMLAGIGGTSGATLIGRFTVSNLFKLFPGIGTVSGGVLSGATASSMTMALAYSYIEVLKRIAKTEMTGRDLTLNEISKLMGASFETQLKEVAGMLPASLKAQLPEWLAKLFSVES